MGDSRCFCFPHFILREKQTTREAQLLFSTDHFTACFNFMFTFKRVLIFFQTNGVHPKALVRRENIWLNKYSLIQSELRMVNILIECKNHLRRFGQSFHLHFLIICQTR